MDSTYFKLCCICPKIDSEEWNKTQGQTVLRTWEVESAHNYENNQDVKMVNSTNFLFLTFFFFPGNCPQFQYHNQNLSSCVV